MQGNFEAGGAILQEFSLMQKEVNVKLLRFGLSVPILTLALLLPAQAQQEVMPDIFDPIPSETPVPKPSPKRDRTQSANTHSQRRRAKTAATRTTATAHTAGAASKRASVERIANTTRAQ
jgi:hypothetical protein